MIYKKVLAAVYGCFVGSALVWAEPGGQGSASLEPMERAAAVEATLPEWQRKLVDWSAARRQAKEESLVPVRPGVPGQRPFWNEAAPSFIYPPAFDFGAVKDTTVYRFTASVIGGKGPEFVFETDRPWAPLTPIWADLPTGEVILRVDGMGKKGGEPIYLAGFRRFYRAAVFCGPYHAPAFDFAESVRRVCLTQFHSPFFQQFQEARDQYDRGHYPSKFEGEGVILSMTILARVVPRLPEADEALLMARNAAKDLIRNSRPAGDALAYFPPTYSEDAIDGPAQGDQPDNIMMIYPAHVGDAYLDLFDLTGDNELFQAAARIAETYRKTQLTNGTWPLMVEARTGERLGMDMVPMDHPVSNVVEFLDRLGARYGLRTFLPVRDKALGWMRAHTLKTFDLTGMFEDTGFNHPPYSNLSINTAAAIAAYLFRHAGDDRSNPALAEEVLRLGEDVFIAWDQAADKAFTPCGYEQYLCYIPINAAAASFMDACLAGYQATGQELYLAKALSIANAMTEMQKRSNGTIPTLWEPGLGDGGWPNCPAHCAALMERLDQFIGRPRPVGGATNSNEQ